MEFAWNNNNAEVCIKVFIGNCKYLQGVFCTEMYQKSKKY